MPSLFDLYTENYNFSHIFAMNQIWHTYNTYIMDKPRFSDALLLFCGCNAEFDDLHTGRKLNIPIQSLFYIPAGYTYRWTFSNTSPTVVSTMLFEFNVTDSNGNKITFDEKPGIFPEGDFGFYKMLFSNVISEFSKPAVIPAQIKSAAYLLLSGITGEKRIKKGNIGCIYKGIKYLEENTDQDKSISEIASMCNVSTNYFERLFKEYAGCTPAQYRTNKKIEKSKLLLSSDSISIGQIAENLGFEDSAYFCRVFKKICGCTPSQYRNNISRGSAF